MATSINQSEDYRPLRGKLALITGASRGIGAGIAQNLAAKGASLILNYVSPSTSKICEELSSSLTAKYGVQHLVIQADMGSPTGPEYLIKTAAEKIPNLKLDIIINNAGIYSGVKAEDCTAELFEKIYSVNVRGPLLLIKHAIPYLPHDRSGRIVNLTSIAAKIGFEGEILYGSSKAALESLTRTWANELSSRATVNSVSPGPVITDLWVNRPKESFKEIGPLLSVTPLARVREGIDDEKIVKMAEVSGGRPAYIEEIAGIVSLVVSSESGWVTGQTIVASGGLPM